MDLKSAAKRLLVRKPIEDQTPVPAGPHEEILNFISHFRNEGTIEVFTSGCCYWFASILYHRFYEEGVIYYHPVMNHYAWYSFDTKKLYDITGELSMDDKWLPWVKYQLADSVHAERLYKQCILKRE